MNFWQFADAHATGTLVSFVIVAYLVCQGAVYISQNIGGRK